jgi:hypothetical protein
MTPVNRPDHGIDGRRGRRRRALLLQPRVISRRRRHGRRRRPRFRKTGHHQDQGGGDRAKRLHRTFSQRGSRPRRELTTSGGIAANSSELRQAVTDGPILFCRLEDIDEHVLRPDAGAFAEQLRDPPEQHLFLLGGTAGHAMRLPRFRLRSEARCEAGRRSPAKVFAASAAGPKAKPITEVYPTTTTFCLDVRHVRPFPDAYFGTCAI